MSNLSGRLRSLEKSVPRPVAERSTWRREPGAQFFVDEATGERKSLAELEARPGPKVLVEMVDGEPRTRLIDATGRFVRCYEGVDWGDL